MQTILLPSLKVVTPAKAGVQVSHKFLKTLDSGLAVIPDPDPGRNDGKENFSTFYESINITTFVKSLLCSHCESSEVMTDEMPF